MEATPCTLPGNLIWATIDYLNLEDWVTFFEALANTPQGRKLSPELGESLIQKIEFKRDLDQSDPTFKRRQTELLEEGYLWIMATRTACTEEAKQTIHSNKQKIRLVLRIVANTGVAPSTRETILQLLVEKI